MCIAKSCLNSENFIGSVKNQEDDLDQVFGQDINQINEIITIQVKKRGYDLSMSNIIILCIQGLRTVWIFTKLQFEPDSSKKVFLQEIC